MSQFIFYKLNLTIFLLFISMKSFAAGHFNCPESIDSKPALAYVPEGWALHVDMGDYTGNKLKEVRFYNGAPEQQAILAPDNENTITNIALWHFGKKRRFDIWQVCTYANTRAMLKRKLSSKITFCEVQFDNNFKTTKIPPQIVKTTCR